MTLTYEVPDNPADPEAAALELIVRVPTDVLGHESPGRETLQEFAGLLSAEGVFAGMSWHDAKHAAMAIMFDAINRDDAAEFLRWRADRVRVDADGKAWDDSGAMIRAFTAAAATLDLKMPAGGAR
ncbi:MAG: hypothetical protein JOZ00_07105 [Mycobacterium sp.]|uniref:hypothetical protein n=1 Tax=Mycobacterium sp. TaxID=1785 RepID=UPI001EBCE52D|nr:hypothetical protein [Mycobacterium sp.]MBV8786441.1 hypothetical protein [Mycobacterium sp.]